MQSFKILLVEIALFCIWVFASFMVDSKYALFGPTMLLVVLPMVVFEAKGAKKGGILGLIWAILGFVWVTLKTGYIMPSLTSGIIPWAFTLILSGAVLGRNLDNKKLTLFLLIPFSILVMMAGVWLW